MVAELSLRGSIIREDCDCDHPLLMRSGSKPVFCSLKVTEWATSCLKRLNR